MGTGPGTETLYGMRTSMEAAGHSEATTPPDGAHRETAAGTSLTALGRPTRWLRSRLLVLRLPRHSLRFRLTILYAALFLLSGGVLLGITYVLVGTFVPGPVASSTQSGGNLIITRKDGSRVVLPANSPEAATVVRAYKDAAARAAEQVAADRQELFVVFGVALVVMAALSAGLGLWVAGRILRRLQTITTAAQDISATNLHRRLALGGPDDELKALGDTFDEFLGRLEATFEAQRRFVANASHELRTPLTMIRTSVEVAEAKPGPVPPEVQKLAAKVGEGLDQADELLEGLLMLARARGDGAVVAPQDAQRVSLTGLVEEAVGTYSDLINERQIRVEQVGSQAEVEGNRTLLARLVDNLIDNAVRHNEVGGWVQAETTDDGRTALIAVVNGGPMLDEREVGQLGQPFRRLGPERTARRGAGLGLSIVAAIAAAHGGSLELAAQPEGGLRATVRLPGTAPGLTRGASL